jgi:5-formyltetrahydrofolate cyclo-ligase
VVHTNLDDAKLAIRERIWSLLEQAGVVELGVHGRIPDFEGAAAAAERLAAQPYWRDAQVVKVVPDTAQLPVRILALEHGKLVYMAAPKLAIELPFYELDPHELAVPPAEAARKETAAQLARSVDVADMRPVDLIVTSSVAVNHDGARLGKGAGYSDIEAALLTDGGLLTDRTVIVTTVHDLQVVAGELPEAAHDFHVDYIVTPSRVIACDAPKRPSGLAWSQLTTAQIAAMPVLARMATSAG